MIKSKLWLAIGAAGILFSCSSDKNDSGEAEDNIVGTWDAHELKIDESTASDDEKNGRDILNYLTAKDCYIMTLTFKQDLNVITENSVNYLEINVNSAGTGIDIPCPSETDTETGTYTYEGGVLTYSGENEQTTSVHVTVAGNTMSVDAEDLDIPNFNTGGQLIFMKR